MGGGVGERAGAVSVSVQPKQIIDPPSASAATLPAIVGLVLLADGIFGKRRGRGESLIGRGRRLEDYVRAGLRRLRRSQGLAATAAGGLHGRPLFSRAADGGAWPAGDRKSTRLNSSH